MKTDALVVPSQNIKELSSETLGAAGARERFLANVSSNVALVVGQSVASLWLTPYLIGYLGIAAYGMVPLANSLISYMGVLTTALDSAVSRFLAIDLEQGDRPSANRTFNTALFGVIAAIAVLSPVVLIISLNFSSLLRVPLGWEWDSSWLFAIGATTLFITVVGSNFALSPFVHSQFLLSNIVNLAGLLARVGFIVAAFSLLRARLWYVSGGALAGALVCLVGYIVLWRKLTPELVIQLSAFDFARFRSLLAMSSWIIVNTVGALLLTRVDLIVVNRYFGAARAASRCISGEESKG